MATAATARRTREARREKRMATDVAVRPSGTMLTAPGGTLWAKLMAGASVMTKVIAAAVTRSEIASMNIRGTAGGATAARCIASRPAALCNRSLAPFGVCNFELPPPGCAQHRDKMAVNLLLTG